ncbi:MAG: hypothetical protein BWY54_00118 [Candidatus Dependentiae bacterium ADurb.Bin331]|nr:MAG: hypothetical protein BWY54_00118 [Candidatus Dependentiae bacterium ADurb.Bin331]
MKQAYKFCLAVTLGCFISLNAQQQSFDDEAPFDFFEELAQSDPLLDENYTQQSFSEKITPEIALKYLTHHRDCPPDAGPDALINAGAILEQDLYLRTNPPNDRAILDYPAFYFPYCIPQNWQFTGQLWFNITPRVALFNDEFMLRDYLAFENKNLIAQLDALAFDINIPKILSLLGDTEVEERRAALMGWFARRRGNWYIQWKTPIAYVERNFNLDEQEQAQISQELTALVGDTFDFETFKKEHLISDKLGLGDSRMTAGYTFVEQPLLWLNAGFLATIPTAFAFTKGIFGSHFPKNSTNPPFDLLEILNLVVAGEIKQVQEIGVTFLLGALDKLSANLLDSEIGNGGHFGLGFFMDKRLYVTPRFSFDTHAEFEYLLPAMEKRFYINRKNPAEFARLLNPDLLECEEDIAFIQQQLIETLFPRVFDTLIFPGVLLKFSTGGHILISPKTDLIIGYDLWWQQQERLGRIIATGNEEALARREIATKPAAIQNKLFMTATYEHNGDNGDWCISINVDKTFLSTGIGSDVSASFRVEYLF